VNTQLRKCAAAVSVALLLLVVVACAGSTRLHNGLACSRNLSQQLACRLVLLPVRFLAE
jgi:hypothetical protein